MYHIIQSRLLIRESLKISWDRSICSERCCASWCCWLWLRSRRVRWSICQASALPTARCRLVLHMTLVYRPSSKSPPSGLKLVHTTFIHVVSWYHIEWRIANRLTICQMYSRHGYSHRYVMFMNVNRCTRQYEMRWSTAMVRHDNSNGCLHPWLIWIVIELTFIISSSYLHHHLYCHHQSINNQTSHISNNQIWFVTHNVIDVHCLYDSYYNGTSWMNGTTIGLGTNYNTSWSTDKSNNWAAGAVARTYNFIADPSTTLCASDPLTDMFIAHYWCDGGTDTAHFIGQPSNASDPCVWYAVIDSSIVCKYMDSLTSSSSSSSSGSGSSSCPASYQAPFNLALSPTLSAPSPFWRPGQGSYAIQPCGQYFLTDWLTSLFDCLT